MQHQVSASVSNVLKDSADPSVNCTYIQPMLLSPGKGETYPAHFCQMLEGQHTTMPPRLYGQNDCKQASLHEVVGQTACHFGASLHKLRPFNSAAQAVCGRWHTAGRGRQRRGACLSGPACHPLRQRLPCTGLEEWAGKQHHRLHWGRRQWQLLQYPPVGHPRWQAGPAGRQTTLQGLPGQGGCARRQQLAADIGGPSGRRPRQACGLQCCSRRPPCIIWHISSQART